MPVLPSPNYKPGLFFLGSHVETLYPYLFRKVEDVRYERQRLELPDGDFIDLDWSRRGSEQLLILCHGLEGSSQSQYMKGMTREANNHRFDVVCINFRSCSGEMNRHLRMYHHGEIGDLSMVIESIVTEFNYRSLALCGFSLGGNVILKYLGTLGHEVPKLIRSAVAVSVPCDLASSSEALDQWYNYLYTRRFMRSLRPKFEYKSTQFPGVIDMTDYDTVKTWQQFDNTYTTKVTGFRDAAEYYEQGSAKNFISGIRTRTLILNASNDPFLQKASYPVDLCTRHPHVHLEMPRYGGHVGFWFPWFEASYAERRAIRFISLDD